MAMFLKKRSPIQPPAHRPAVDAVDAESEASERVELSWPTGSGGGWLSELLKWRDFYSGLMGLL